jgi:hypothetical protein
MAVVLLTFDDRGMHLHTFADETEPGAVLDVQRGFGNFLVTHARAATPPDARLERLGELIADAAPARFAPAKGRYTHLHATVPARRLDEWFAPFARAQDGR